MERENPKAFPVSLDDFLDIKDHPEPGMTLLDYFAGAFGPQICAVYLAFQDDCVMDEKDAQAVAAMSYDMAKFMLEERARRIQ